MRQPRTRRGRRRRLAGRRRTGNERNGAHEDERSVDGLPGLYGIDAVLVQPSAYPTNMYMAILTPADIERADQYGEIGKIPQALFSTFMTMFRSENAPMRRRHCKRC